MVVRIADTPVSDKEERLTVDTAVGTGGDKPLAQIGKNCYLSPDINLAKIFDTIFNAAKRVTA